MDYDVLKTQRMCLRVSDVKEPEQMDIDAIHLFERRRKEMMKRLEEWNMA